MSITNRRTALVASGALVALAGSLFTFTAAHADATGFSLNPANKQTADPFTLTPQDETNAVTTSTGTVALWPHWTINGVVPPVQVFPTDPYQNAENADSTSAYEAEFILDPTTSKLYGNLGADGVAISPTAVTYGSVPGTLNPDKYVAALDKLTPGQTFQWIVSLPRLNSDGSLGDFTTVGANDPYYVMSLEYFGVNPETGVYEVSTVDDPNYTVHEKVKTATTTTVTGTANSDGSVTLAAAVSPTVATGTVTFSAPGTSSVTVPVSSGAAGTTINHSAGLPYDQDVTFTATYNGDSNYGSSSNTAVVHTAVAPANHGQAEVPETVTIAIADSGELTLAVASGGITFGSAQEDISAGQFTASAALPQVTVTDTRVTKGSWSLNASSTDLKTSDKANVISAGLLSWARPTVTTPENSGAVAGAATQGLGQEAPLATFTDGGVLGQLETQVDTDLSLTAPITQAQGDYAGTLTITLI
jgi:hypothetical protein